MNRQATYATTVPAARTPKASRTHGQLAGSALIRLVSSSSTSLCPFCAGAATFASCPSAVESADITLLHGAHVSSLRSSGAIQGAGKAEVRSYRPAKEPVVRLALVGPYPASAAWLAES